MIQSINSTTIAPTPPSPPLFQNLHQLPPPMIQSNTSTTIIPKTPQPHPIQPNNCHHLHHHPPNTDPTH
ncbi:hypothetical protein O181_110200 [Austropuccinia psidii MF-1]|uniref:Uncharacterized protein n=1 Tax=Austropuccinia psidii MF-1 TaxID=1389203 RepID=A0A9Q3PRA2_9BASI|nr:hypothetical protein [Austropuccinia psidii MF-1]